MSTPEPITPEPMEIERGAPVRARAEIHVAAPPAVVWATLADFASWTRWNGDVRRMQLHGEPVAGTRFSWQAGGMAIESRLLAVAAPALLAWSGRTLGTRAVHVSRFVADEGGGTLASTEESFAGPLPWLFRGPLRRTLDKSLRSGLAALKAESERRAGSRAGVD